MVQKKLLLWAESLGGDDPVTYIEFDDSIQENETH